MQCSDVSPGNIPDVSARREIQWFLKLSSSLASEEHRGDVRRKERVLAVEYTSFVSLTSVAADARLQILDAFDIIESSGTTTPVVDYVITACIGKLTQRCQLNQQRDEVDKQRSMLEVPASNSR